MSKQMKERRPVLVTTTHKGVFFGYAEETSGDVIHLKRARCAIYWSVECNGFMGLAKYGPKSGSRVGPAVDIEIRQVTSVSEVTPEAVKLWEAFQC